MSYSSREPRSRSREIASHRRTHLRKTIVVAVPVAIFGGAGSMMGRSRGSGVGRMSGGDSVGRIKAGVLAGEGQRLCNLAFSPLYIVTYKGLETKNN